ncbi:MAG: hypothetical protein P0Y65_04560 [Candidatus Devosia phytovorans]|uniref:Uncharacterized protein n=1 Tax=Candidatus Devosia phytovorans TaxID=3121372 RepID=A0AAJ5VX48_9HYPH|nr:hypothetical protein [Devosia sp.]WEK05535.1 MAG: hypothetical protein P0Y65_04560 [Devosia sp.]
MRPQNRPVEAAPVAPPKPVEAAAAQIQYQRPPQPQPQTQPEVKEQAKAEYEPPSSGTTFAAAVLSGALTPTPQSLGELYARIGASDIPESMQMRLKDLQV